MHAVVVLTVGLLFNAPSLEDVNRAVRDVLDDGSIQSEYPGADDRGERTERTPPPSRSPGSGSFQGGSTVVTTLFWVLVGVGVALLLVYLVRELGGYTRNAEAEAAPPVATPTAPPSEKELGDAAALAADGRYEEAVHLLLLHALRDIEREGARVVSHTSREVLRAAALEREAREAMEDLVGVVEISWFGGRPIDENGYEQAVASYRRFQAARA